MTTDSTRRAVSIRRVEPGQFVVRNQRGGEIAVGTGAGGEFTPVELLLAAIGGCTSVDVDILTSRRSEPDSFEVLVEADKVRDGSGNHLAGIKVTFRLAFPDTEQGDQARAVLPSAVRRSHDQICTVGRTIELGTPIATRIE
ncbi:MAG TPA: OsmC family protein [Streptosporangiaceae bacterium]